MGTLWKEAYRIGIDKIDEQHHLLFDKTEELLNIARNGDQESSRKKCMEIIDFLVGYTIIHFETEEDVQLERNYISYAQHVLIHKEFQNTVLVYKELLINNFSTKALKHFIGTLVTWLVNHVCVCDRKITKNIPIKEMESFVDAESFIRNVAKKLLTDMYSIPILETKSCIYKGSVEGDVMIRTAAEAGSRHLFLYGMSEGVAAALYQRMSGMTHTQLDDMDEVEQSALTEMGNIITTYAMNAIEDDSGKRLQLTSNLYLHEFNETEYNISNSVIVEFTTAHGKMEILYCPVKA